MKIGVLIPGHLRAWEFCKKNFMDTVYDTNYDISVFVDTYNEVYRTDYKLHNENQMNETLSFEEVEESFSGINVVSLTVEKEDLGFTPHKQGRKIMNCYQTFRDYEITQGNFDLCVKTRFDILLDKKLDYNKILDEITKKPKLLYMSRGAVNMPLENDMLAVSNSNVFGLYCKRFVEYPDCCHKSLTHVRNEYGLEYYQSINVSIVRLGGPGKDVTHNGINYKVFQ